MMIKRFSASARRAALSGLAAILSTGLAVGLSGCAGFTPMHATPGADAAFERMSVEVADGQDETDRAVGFLIRQRLGDRIALQPGATAPYRLVVDPSIRRVGLGLTGEDRATRFDSVVRANWRLLRRADGTVIDSGSSQSTTTYSANRDPYQLLSTTDQANARAARDVADQMLVDVALTLSELPDISQG